MTYNIIDVDRQDGTVQNAYVDIAASSVNDLAKDILIAVQNYEHTSGANMVRGNTSRPMVRTADGDKIYLRDEGDGTARVRLNLARDMVTDVVLDAMGYGQEHADDEWEKRDERQKGDRRRTEEQHREPEGSIDGQVVITPPYTKEDSNYHGEAEGPYPEFNCRDCVHYVEEGGCKLVQGDIDPDGYCEDLYTDIQINGRVIEGEFETNLIAWGEVFDDRFGNIGMHHIVNSIREALRRRM